MSVNCHLDNIQQKNIVIFTYQNTKQFCRFIIIMIVEKQYELYVNELKNKIMLSTEAFGLTYA